MWKECIDEATVLELANGGLLKRGRHARVLRIERYANAKSSSHAPMSCYAALVHGAPLLCAMGNLLPMSMEREKPWANALMYVDVNSEVHEIRIILVSNTGYSRYTMVFPGHVAMMAAAKRK